MPADSNKTITEASLDNLHDIIVPDAVGFLPPAPGWYIILFLLLALLFYFAIQAVRRYKKSQYRRDALHELADYHEAGRQNAIALLSLAKRVGIAAYGREKIAGLSDDAWWDFMESHSKTVINKTCREEIRSLLYDDRFTLSDALFDTIAASVTQWVKTHRMDGDV